jgi:DNA gyrase subunit A
MSPKDKGSPNIGKVRAIDIDHEMQQTYLSYATHVSVARALPGARDGLKPVYRPWVSH